MTDKNDSLPTYTVTFSVFPSSRQTLIIKCQSNTKASTFLKKDYAYVLLSPVIKYPIQEYFKANLR